MKVTTKVNLNVRVGAPRLDAPCYQYIAPGSELEVDGKLYTGDYFEGINTWMKDEAGNYYWSGGIVQKDAIAWRVSTKLIGNLPWWINKFGIDKIWDMGITGKGIKVAVLDTGIGGNDNLRKENIDGFNFILNNSDYSDLTNGHGTHIAGIIGGSGDQMVGLAPEVKLFIGKVVQADGKLDSQALINALHYCLDINVDIINCSFIVSPAEFKKDLLLQNNLLPAIQNVVNHGIYITAACGNYAIPLDCYPALYNECISVTAIDQTRNLFRDACSSNTIDISAPGVEIFSTGLNNVCVYQSGTSQSAAYLAGFLALAKDCMNQKKKWSYGGLLNQLLDPANLTNSNLPLNQFGKGIINPLNIINSLSR